MTASKVNGSNFWNTDLEDVEAVFLPKNRKITDLPTSLNEKTPAQGSVLLNKIVNIEEVVRKPTFWQRVFYPFLR